MKHSKLSLGDMMKVKELGALLPLIILVIVASAVNPAFLNSNNLFDILKTTSYTTILAVPLTMLTASVSWNGVHALYIIYYGSGNVCLKDITFT